MQAIVGHLDDQDLQAALLTCQEWHAAITRQLLHLRPRLLRAHRLALWLPHLQQLDLSACRRVEDADLQELHSMPGLRVLSLHGCELVTNRGLAAVAAMPLLSSLSLYNCCKVTDTGVRKLHGLTSLDIAGCMAISERGTAAIAANCPNLRTLKVGHTELQARSDY